MSNSGQQYQDVDRTYNDTAQALSHYSSLSPKTEVYSELTLACVRGPVSDVS